MGHLQADLDPLEIKTPIVLPSLAPSAYDITEADMNTDIRFMNSMSLFIKWRNDVVVDDIIFLY